MKFGEKSWIKSVFVKTPIPTQKENCERTRRGSIFFFRKRAPKHTIVPIAPRIVRKIELDKGRIDLRKKPGRVSAERCIKTGLNEEKASLSVVVSNISMVFCAAS